MYSFQIRSNREIQLPNKTTLGRNQVLSKRTSLKEVESDLAWFEHDVGNYLKLCSPQAIRDLKLELAISSNGKILFSKNI